MLQVVNNTPYLPLMTVLPNEAGIDTLFVVVKGTFPLSSTPVVAPESAPPNAKDVYWEEPGTSSLKYASELHVGKAGTDVVMVGHAYAPKERPVAEVLVAVIVAERRKIVRVVGDRVWGTMTGAPSRPEPFTKMPLLYERAFGGVHEPGGRSAVLAEERNPLGVGFRGRRAPREVVGHKLPNLEDPSEPIRSFGDQPAPAGFGFTAPAWLPRRQYAGTYDEAWKANRAPYLPRDFDRRFNNAACPELTFNRFLAGGEPLEITGASPEGLLRVKLPTARPRVMVAINWKLETPPVVLETVLLEPDLHRFSLTWRVAVPCDKRALKVQSITIEGGP
ncbi:MAG TPA: DUF2169 domain-containing protein [Polyangia bacterium]|nr:DUF2169 domain-containing protein [Polyangia bacterium]